ncbi:hypothetical protein [Paracoccus mutanolyticus]|uniref:hypothetical protein n=1 Tax=Paracoccus mutanolyticus TaxID=1499308 RepID=UPI001CB9BB60|nr:hypothetical protein [Paracoccus mutanolyticus]
MNKPGLGTVSKEFAQDEILLSLLQSLDETTHEDCIDARQPCYARSFTAYSRTQKGKHRIKIIARYQQVDGVNKIVARVVAGQPRKGLIWHFQGSGKSLLMLFAARKLRLHPALAAGYGRRSAAGAHRPRQPDLGRQQHAATRRISGSCPAG